MLMGCLNDAFSLSLIDEIKKLQRRIQSLKDQNDPRQNPRIVLLEEQLKDKQRSHQLVMDQRRLDKKKRLKNLTSNGLNYTPVLPPPTPLHDMKNDNDENIEGEEILIRGSSSKRKFLERVDKIILDLKDSLRELEAIKREY